MVYCLLPDKTRSSYQKVFTLLEQNVANDLQLDFSPDMVLSDFELAIMQASNLKGVFPAITNKGCYFHFCQALLRKVQNLGLQAEYQQNGEVRSFIRKTGALAFIPLRGLFAWVGMG